MKFYVFWRILTRVLFFMKFYVFCSVFNVCCSAFHEVLRSFFIFREFQLFFYLVKLHVFIFLDMTRKHKQLTVERISAFSEVEQQ